MPKTDEFAFLDATAQAELVRKKEVKPIELVDAAIERIERLNPQLNAVVTPMYDLAREGAKRELPDGPFTGVPFLLKDLDAAYAGVRMTAGSRMVKDYIPDKDDEIVKRFKRAGLIVVGKTNVPEFGFKTVTEPVLLGIARNPWDTDKTPGGSSGGSAAAVAAGMVPAAHGNDGGGSIRIPASCCGLFGLKPSRYRNPMGSNLFSIQAGIQVEGVLTRSVRDSAAMLDATAGPDIGDTGAAPTPVRPFLEEVDADPGYLNIAFTTSPGEGVPVDEDCITAVHKTAGMLSDLGHNVEEVTPGNLLPEDAVKIYHGIICWDVEKWARFSDQIPAEDNLETSTWALYQEALKHKAIDHLHAETATHHLALVMGRFLSKYDLLLTPTLAGPPKPIGAFSAQNLDAEGEMFRWCAFTPIANLTGQPAMTVPLHWTLEGLPVGSQFIARYGDEATLFRLAAQLEEAHSWAQRRPPISASNLQNL